MNELRRQIYTLTEANCDSGEISEFLGLPVSEVKKVMVVARNVIANKQRYWDKKAKS